MEMADEEDVRPRADLHAVLQFIITRQRAGNVIEEGAAEMLWLRYPLTVMLNAIVWTLMLSTLGRVTSPFRSAP
jgi:hypothetical protein